MKMWLPLGTPTTLRHELNPHLCRSILDARAGTCRYIIPDFISSGVEPRILEFDRSS